MAGLTAYDGRSGPAALAGSTLLVMSKGSSNGGEWQVFPRVHRQARPGRRTPFMSLRFPDFCNSSGDSRKLASFFGAAISRGALWARSAQKQEMAQKAEILAESGELSAEGYAQISFFRKYQRGRAKSATYDRRKKAEEAGDIADIFILGGESASHRRFVLTSPKRPRFAGAQRARQPGKLGSFRLRRLLWFRPPWSVPEFPRNWLCF